MWTILKGAREFLKEVEVAIFWEAIQLAPKLIIWAGPKIILWTFLKEAKEFLQEMLGEGAAASQPAPGCTVPLRDPRPPVRVSNAGGGF